MLRRVRSQVFSALRRLGAFQRLADSRWRAQRLLILCYHGISLADEHDWNSQLYISAVAFRARLDTLRRGGYNVLALADALARLSAGTLPPRSVALTFDDGAHDFHARALPLLWEYGYPATVYLTTYYSEFQKPVFDTAASYLLYKAGGAGLPRRSAHRADAGAKAGGALDGVVPGLSRFDLGADAGRRAAAARIRAHAGDARLSASQKDDLLRRMAAALGLDYDQVFAARLLHVMTPDEVREVAASGIDVQLHTHRHRTPRERSAFLREIEDNRASIARMLGPAPRNHFCYPSGAYETPFLDWLREAGVRSATTCDFRLASADDDMLLLPRLVDTGNLTPLELEACLAGVADLYPHRRRARAAFPVIRSGTQCQNAGG